MKELILGGIKSGKSHYALRDLESCEKKVFIATAEPLDNMMEEKIRLHKASRGKGFETFEEPIAIAKIIKILGERKMAPLVVLDCLTLWLSNLMHHFPEETSINKNIEDFIQIVKEYSGPLRIVSNEVGFGVIPDSRLAREYADKLGILNQITATSVDRVILMVAGHPIIVKEN